MAFLPRIFFLWFVYGCASSPGCNQHMKVHVWIFSAQYRPVIKLQKVGWNFSSFGRGYSLGLLKISEKLSRNSFLLKIHIKISTESGTKRVKFHVKRMSIHPRKKSNSFVHEPSFQPWQWWMKNLLPILWDKSGAQISAKTQQTQWRTYGKNFRPKYQRSKAW